MYLKLNSIKQTNKYSIDDFIILSEVVDSGMSYEVPTLVRSVEELEIWFGKNFSDYNYLSELLNSNITLYLTRPISEVPNKYNDQYVDLTKYKIDPTIYKDKDSIEFNGSDKTIYKIAMVGGSKIDKNTSITYDLFIWYQNDFALVNNLPQVINPTYNSMSLNNRDTLSLCNSNISEIPLYFHPEYINNGNKEYTEGVFSIEGVVDWNKSLDRIEKGYDTLSITFSIDLSEFKNITSDLLESPYIILEDRYGRNNLIYFDIGNGLPKSVDKKYYTTETSEGNYESLYKSLKVSKDVEENKITLLKSIEDLGYRIINTKDINTFLVISNRVINFTNFHTIPGLNMSIDFRSTNNIISNCYNSNEIIRFVSKTIGSDESEDSMISVEVKELEDDLYRFIITRFDYYEVFEGSILKNNYNRIDNIINENSKLVKCDLINNMKSQRVLSGKWKLKGAIRENYTTVNYWKSLENIFNPSGDNVYFDYFLIPNRYNYFNKEEVEFDKYKQLLEYSSICHNQVLIQNNYIGDSGDYIYNYIEDRDNRLLYFIGDFIVSDNSILPSYYTYLKGLLLNKYSFKFNDILYKGKTVDKDFYTISNIEKELEKYKCNYIVCNNHFYYYNKYQYGEKYNTTGWMRFCIEKINRELEKNKWKFLNYKSISDINLEIIRVLKRISDSFTIISSIDINFLDVDWINNKMYLSIDTSVRDLIDNNIELDITLNFNN